MACTVRKVARAAIGAALLLLSACEKSEPVAAPVDPLLGAWCLQGEAPSAGGKRTLGGSKWELRADGTYGYAFKWHRWDEPWSRNGNTLSLGKLGAHQVVELTASSMILSQGNVHKYFGRDCGPEYAKAERVHQLVDAAENAAQPKVEELLGQGADIDGIDLLGVLEQTALIAAVRANDLPMVKLLLGRGARHDVETRQGVTAMNAAELAGYRDIVEELLRAGAKPSSKPPVPPPPTPEEIENARVAKLLDLHPGALINRDAPPPQPAAPQPQPLPVVAAAPSAPAAPAAPAQPAPQPAPKPEEQKTEQEKELDALKKELCAKRPANLDAPLTAEMTEMLKSIGMSPDEYIAQQKTIYDQTCK